MEAWLIIGPFILMIAWLIQTAALYPKDEYFFGRHTGEDFRYTSAGTRLITRFRVVLALGTALTILYFAGTLTGKSSLWDLLGFLPLFLAPAVAYTWNWCAAKRYQIQGFDEVTLGPTVPESIPRHLGPLLVISAALPLVCSCVSMYFADNHRPSVMFVAVFPVYWALKHCARAYALARHSRPFEGRSPQIRRLSEYAFRAGLGAAIFLVADTFAPFRDNPFAYFIGMVVALMLTVYLDRRRPAATIPSEATPSDSWKAGYFYLNPRDPAWIVPRPNGSSYAANLGHASAYLLVLPEALALTAYVAHFSV